MAPKNVYRPGRSVAKGGKELTKKQEAFKKRYTPPKKDKPKKPSASNKQSNKILQELDEAQKKKDRQESTTTTGTTLPGSSTKNTKNFIDDLKNAYKSGLFTGGTQTKAFMDKYNLDSDDIVKLRVGIDQGLGTVIGSSDQSKIGSNVLKDIVGDLRSEGILTTASRSPDFLQQRAGDIFEPGMTKYDREPITGLMGLSPLANIGIRGLDLVAGGSDKGAPGSFYGRNVLGLRGEELDNFAAAVANDETLYRQMMATPEMQDYQLNQFRAEVNRNAMAEMRKGDPDPISGAQPGSEGGEGDDMIASSSTDPGSGTVPYSPALQNFYTFFDPTIGKYRSGTYDEYLQYVTAKDGGIIQLNQGGTNEDPTASNDNLSGFVDDKVRIVDLYKAREEIMNLVPSIDPKTGLPRQSEVEGKEMILKDIDAKIDQLLNRGNVDNTLNNLSGFVDDKVTIAALMNARNESNKDEIDAKIDQLLNSAARMAEEDQPVRDIFGKAKESLDGIFQNLKGRRGLAEDPVTTASTIVLDNRDKKLKVVPINRETLEMIENGTYSQTTREAVESGVMVSPSPISDRRLVNPDTNDQIDDMMRDQFINRLYEEALEFQRQMEKERGTTIRDPKTNKVIGYNVADGGIIGLKEGGMNDMMQADSLMFKDPSDESEWEYNV
tara:strand:- start:1101 stop:3095 length:1995 start_codon:yes stop_codon:yes gene_type:complete